MSLSPGTRLNRTIAVKISADAGVDAFRTHYVPTFDGQRFLVNTQIGDPEPNPITVVLNWTAGLKK